MILDAIAIYCIQKRAPAYTLGGKLRDQDKFQQTGKDQNFGATAQASMARGRQYNNDKRC